MEKKGNKKGRIILIFFIVILIPAIWYLLLNKEPDHEMATETLTGSWVRSDGGYTIQIMEVKEDGKLESLYLNPNPINVGKSEWRITDGLIQIYVELQDENYPGSLYQLTFDKEQKILFGTYYQAVEKATFEVSFTKK